MLNQLKRSPLIAGLLHGIALLVFQIRRYTRDQLFLENLNNTRFRPSAFGRIVAFCLRAHAFVRTRYKREFLDIALRRYARYNRRHYSPDGRGYIAEALASDAEKVRLYGQPTGRVSEFLTSHRHFLGYQDGDTFLDVGCGRGQNLKVLSDAVPKARLHGIDMNAAAVEVIRLAAEDGTVSAAVGDLTDQQTFCGIADGAFDHVIMSHVFSLILSDGLTATRDTRAMIVGEMIRIARKTVMIIDGPAIMAPAPAFEIEQKDRGVFHEDAAAYFPVAKGHLTTLRSGASMGLLFIVSEGAAD